MVNLSVTVEDARLNAALGKLSGVFGDPRPMFRPLAERVVLAARGQVDTAGRRSGRPWAARKESTLRAITSANRKGFTFVGLPGRASDRMFRSVGTLGGPDSVYEEAADSVTVGTRVTSRRGFPYPRAFHYGTARQPARPVYDLTERDVREMVAVGKKSFRERIEPLGLQWSEAAGAAF